MDRVYKSFEITDCSQNLETNWALELSITAKLDTSSRKW